MCCPRIKKSIGIAHSDLTLCFVAPFFRITFAGAPVPRDRDAGPKRRQLCWGRRDDEERPEVLGCGGAAGVPRTDHLRKVRGKGLDGRSLNRDCCVPDIRYRIDSRGVAVWPSIWQYFYCGRAADKPSVSVTGTNYNIVTSHRQRMLRFFHNHTDAVKNTVGLLN